MKNENNLLPATFRTARGPYYSEADMMGVLVLKALSEGITEEKELLKITGARKSAELIRAMDKMAMRKGWHEALAKAGLDFEYISDKLKKLIETGLSESIKLKSLQTLLRSLGLDRYEIEESSANSWEDAILKMSKREFDKVEEPKKVEHYEVTTPEIPATVRKRQEEERKLADQLYDK